MPSQERVIRHFSSPNIRIQLELSFLAEDFDQAMRRGDRLSAQDIIDRAKVLKKSPFPLILIQGGRA